MRKLGIFVAILFLVAFAITLGCAVSGDFKAMVVKALTTAGGTVYTVASDRWMALANYVSANGTYFLAYTLGVLVFGGIFWLGIRKLWVWGATHRPHLRSPSIASTTSTPELGATRSQTPIGATTRPPAKETISIEPEAKQATETVKEESAEK